jgi:circadian clock protein KaiC
MANLTSMIYREEEKMSATAPDLSPHVTTGIAGLDEILGGGLPRSHLYLIHGETGTGKTTLGLQFLLEGVRQGESGLYFTLAETALELQQVAVSHGWSLEESLIYELSVTALAQTEVQQTIFPPSEIELDELVKTIIQQLHYRQPQRVVFDPVSELRLLAASPLRYRRQILLLRQHLVALGCTTLLLSDELTGTDDRPPLSLVHGLIMLKRTVPIYGPVRRSLEVTKLRSISYLEGDHDFCLRTGGLEVYPRLQVSPNRGPINWETLSSGVSELDMLLGGGLETGTACLISGQAGTGKTTIALLYAYAAAHQGQSVAIYLFDERIDTWLHRVRRLGLDMPALIEQGVVHLHQINTGDISPGKFAYQVRQLVEQHKIKVLVMDSLTGYLQTMIQEDLLMLQMHELLTYLGQQGVLSLLVVTQHGLLDLNAREPLDLSYLTDTVLVLRHFEAEGAIHHAVSVLKKRHGIHEGTVREFRITANGIQVGPPLTAFSGVLAGIPRYEGTRSGLLSDDRSSRSSLPREE